MRLQIEGGELPYTEHPEVDDEGQTSPSRRGKIPDATSDDESDKEEEAFLATQRQYQRKFSNPGSGRVSK